MTDTVIFDFDGVIADSGAIFTETLAEILNRKQPFTDAEIKQMRNSSPREIMKLLGIKNWQLPRIAAKGKKVITAKMHKVEVFDDMPEAIKELHSRKYKIYILSTNTPEAISKILDKYDLSDYITQIYSGTKIFGKAKRLNSLLRKERLSKNQCVYVGDEIRDIEATKWIGIKCIAVEWGYSTPGALKSYGPEAMVSKPKQLNRAITSL